MEKTPLREEEIKELEDEIDLAVDRLFVEKRKGFNEPLVQEPPGLKPSPEPSFEPIPPFEPVLESSLEVSEKPEKDFDFEESFAAPPPPLPSPPPSYLKSIDQLEAQLLALEWEI